MKDYKLSELKAICKNQPLVDERGSIKDCSNCQLDNICKHIYTYIPCDWIIEKNNNVR